MQQKSSSRTPAAENNVASFLSPATGLAFWGPALAGTARWNGQVYEGLATLGSEWLDFVTGRLKQNLRLPQQLCSCRSPEEIRDLHAAYWQRAIEDYRTEFAIMAKLGSTFVNNNMAVAQNRIEAAAREMSRPFADAA
jgi:hypothetical protein